MSDIVQRLRDQGKDAFARQYSLGMFKLCDEAASEIERLRKGIQDYLDGNFGPDFASKHDKCPHDRFGWEDCGNCIDAHFAAVLNPPTPSPIGSETP